jgi:hypothetical protein
VKPVILFEGLRRPEAQRLTNDINALVQGLR